MKWKVCVDSALSRSKEGVFPLIFSREVYAAPEFDDDHCSQSASGIRLSIQERFMVCMSAFKTTHEHLKSPSEVVTGVGVGIDLR